MTGRIISADDDGKRFEIMLDAPDKFKCGDQVEIKPKKKTRSLSQNRLYWAYLSWVISREGGGLIDQGHFSPDALHEDIKAWITDKYPHQFDGKAINRFTTTVLDTKEFNAYMEIVDRELMVEFFGINTAGFWGEVNAAPTVPF